MPASAERPRRIHLPAGAESRASTGTSQSARQPECRTGTEGAVIGLNPGELRGLQKLGTRACGGDVMCSKNRIHEASPRPCEPITAHNPGVKCPPSSSFVAQKLLDSAELVGSTLQATYRGVEFVARKTRTTDEGVVWHGNPEARDRMDLELKKRWREKGLIQSRDFRAYATRRKVRVACGRRFVGG